MEISEEQIREWVRSEQARIDAEKQSQCKHAISGTLNADDSVTCHECGKVLRYVEGADDGPGPPAGPGWLPV